VEATAVLINYVTGYGLLGDIRFNIKGRLLGICSLFPFATVFQSSMRIGEENHEAGVVTHDNKSPTGIQADAKSAYT